MATAIFYGLQYKNSNLSETKFRAFARLLFLSQSNTIEDVQKIINNHFKRTENEIKDFAEGLKNEIMQYKALAHGSDDVLQQISDKLQVWMDNFDCKKKDIDEYISFYELPDSFVKNLTLVSKGEIINPKRIFHKLNRYVIGQEEAKKIISSAVYIHLLRRQLIKPQIALAYKKEFSNVPLLPNPNIILIGTTGTGKSYILKTVAKLFGLPFLKIDCASLTSSGYSGNGLNEYLVAFYKSCGEDIEKLNNAIIFFDEFDKLSEQALGENRGSVGGIEMQQEFLNLIEDKEYLLNVKGGKENSTLINFNQCMFVFGGSFFGIEQIVQKRIGQQEGIGFKNLPVSESTKTIKRVVNQDDLIKFGILPELVSRVNHIVMLKDHTKESIIEIIKTASDSILKAYQNYFEIHFDKLTIKSEVYELIAEKVLQAGTGARAINGILNELLKDLIYESPNMIEENFIIDEAYFKNIFGDNN